MRKNNNKKMQLLGAAMLLSLACATPSQAAVSAAEAARLGQDLTPQGAMMAADGAIPAWDGGITQMPAGFKPGEKHPNPYAGDAPLLVIDSTNYQRYRNKLSPGQIALIQKYPDTFRMPIYPTRRSAVYPDNIYKATAQNAVQTQLTEDGNGLVNYVEGTPFPIPASGLEVVWNHIVRYRGDSVQRVVNQVTPQANGDYTPVRFKEEFTFRNKLTDFQPGKDENVLFYFQQNVVSPARMAGNVLLIHETINQVKGPRKAWIYNAGQRRVRRAPQVAYDGPGTASEGMRTSDNYDMYNGAPDRYDWKLIGKQEMYIPYNAYELNSGDLTYDDIVKPGHLNPEHTRYELHRVWKVEATLKEGERHIYAKRVFYFDEDTWQASVIDHYDGRGTLWRVAESHQIVYYDQKTPWFAAEVLHDLLSGRYLATGLDNEEPGSYRFGAERASRHYTPSALRRAGRR